jgi:hypothetical protein
MAAASFARALSLHVLLLFLLAGSALGKTVKRDGT